MDAYITLFRTLPLARIGQVDAEGHCTNAGRIDRSGNLCASCWIGFTSRRACC